MNRKPLFFLSCLPVFLGYPAGILTVFFTVPDVSAAERFLSASPSQNWGQSFLSGPAFVFGTVLCGVFLFGWLAVFPLVFYKAFGLGYSAGLFLGAFGLRGLLPVGLCLFPSALVETLLLIRASRDAFVQSRALFRGFSADPTPFFSGLKAYLLRSLVLLQCSAFVVLWDLFLSPLMLSSFRDLL